MRRYANTFDADPAEVELGALAYAAQCEIENQLRSRERGARPRITCMAGLLTELVGLAEPRTVTSAG